MGTDKADAIRERMRELGRKGGQATAEKRKKEAEVRADLRAKARFQDASDDAAQVLIDAALGKGAFSKLDPKERVGYAVKVLEYGVGRPRPVEPPAPPPVAGPAGLQFEPAVEAPDGQEVPAPSDPE